MATRIGKISVRDAKKNLTIVWGAAFGVLLLILIPLTLFGDKLPEYGRYWSWFLPTILPGIGLIVSVTIIDAGAGVANKKVDNYFYRFALWLSIFYLALVTAAVMTLILSEVICVEGLCQRPDCVNDGLNQFLHVKPSGGFQADKFTVVNFILSPISGFVIGALGIFFIKPEGRSAP